MNVNNQMEDFDKYLNAKGQISSEHTKSVIKRFEGKTYLLEKCLFLRSLIVTEKETIDSLETEGLRDVLHGWFESSVALGDVHFLSLLLETLSGLSYNLGHDFSDLVKYLSNLNNPDLTIQAKQLLVKWRSEAEIIRKKNEFTYINLDKGSTVKRIKTRYRSAGLDGEDDDEEDRLNTLQSVDINNISEKTDSSASNNNNKNKQNIDNNNRQMGTEESGGKTHKVVTIALKKKRVSWATNENLKTIIIYKDKQDESEEETFPPPPSQSPEISKQVNISTPLFDNSAKVVPAKDIEKEQQLMIIEEKKRVIASSTSSSSSPKFDNDIKSLQEENIEKKLNLKTIEERKLAFAKKLFEVINSGRNEKDVKNLSSVEIYDILRIEQNNLKYSGIVVIPPR